MSTVQEPPVQRTRGRPPVIPQGIFWIGTIWAPHALFPIDTVPPGISWIRGQLEEGAGGRKHWQVVFSLAKRGRLQACTTIFGVGHHFELSRSSAVNAYVWKEETSLGERFEKGAKPIRVNSSTDWDAVWESAKSGDLTSIPPRIRVCSYRTLRAIGSDFSCPVGLVRDVRVFWGPSGTGKSRRAWDEAGAGAYAKCPRSKFWDGYQSHDAVIIDEFRGGIDVAHLLRWFDRYPVRVEIKGSTRPLNAKGVWITSNIPPVSWYPDLDADTFLALQRRLSLVEHMETLPE